MSAITFTNHVFERLMHTKYLCPHACINLYNPYNYPKRQVQLIFPICGVENEVQTGWETFPGS